MKKTYLLTRIISSHDYLRTDTVEGTIAFLPEVGSGLIMLADSLTDPALQRLVQTTPIEELVVLSEAPYEASFRTRNSHYRLEEKE